MAEAPRLRLGQHVGWPHQRLAAIAEVCLAGGSPDSARYIFLFWGKDLNMQAWASRASDIGTISPVSCLPCLRRSLCAHKMNQGYKTTQNP